MFRDFYKQTIDTAELQEVRRRSLLQSQKEKRKHLSDENRDIGEVALPAISCRQGKLRSINFKGMHHSCLSLQMSEWLRERPKLSDWLLVPCPIGQRCMVVSKGGRTQMYNKSGRRQQVFRSHLSGDRSFRNAMTILDCIYVKENETFYVLDVLIFANYNLTDCDAEFRFFWLRSKFEEHDNLKVRSSDNERVFQLLDHYDFENTVSVSVVLQRYPIWPDNKPELDGFLFYHKEASYTCGTTPLVCWLFAFMVPDIIGYSVNGSYHKPIDYEHPHQYMDMFDKQLKYRKNQRGSKSQDNSTELAHEATLKEQNPELALLLDAERQLEMEVLNE